MSDPTPRPGDLATELDVAAGTAAEAAELLRSLFHHRPPTLEKGDRDLVTQADLDSEALITRRLQAAFPDDVVIGEEGTGRGEDPTGRRRWYVDPVDGTTNFVKGLRSWGVSVGLCAADDTLLLGVIVLPLLGEVYTAVRGGGARRNGVPIRSSDVDRLDRLVVTYAHARGSAEQWGGERRFRAGIAAMMGATLGTRIQGCATADLTGVASGTLDVMWAGALSKWDVAAGLLIAQEAGAVATDPSGAPVTTPVPSFLLAPKAVHADVDALWRDAAA